MKPTTRAREQGSVNDQAAITILTAPPLLSPGFVGARVDWCALVLRFQGSVAPSSPSIPPVVFFFQFLIFKFGRPAVQIDGENGKHTRLGCFIRRASTPGQRESETIAQPPDVFLLSFLGWIPVLNFALRNCYTAVNANHYGVLVQRFAIRSQPVPASREHRVCCVVHGVCATRSWVCGLRTQISGRRRTEEYNATHTQTYEEAEQRDSRAPSVCVRSPENRHCRPACVCRLFLCEGGWIRSRGRARESEQRERERGGERESRERERSEEIDG